MPFQRPPELLQCASVTLHADQSVFSVPTILPASILRQVARGLADASEYVQEVLNRLPGMRQAELSTLLAPAGNRPTSGHIERSFLAAVVPFSPCIALDASAAMGAAVDSAQSISQGHYRNPSQSRRGGVQ